MFELHDHYRSSSSHRVRIALGLKGLTHAVIPVDLARSEQHDAAFRAVNPQGLLPVYSDDRILLTQSLAIIEYLDERFPDPPLLPADPAGRARARQIAMMICADMQPLTALRVMGYLRDSFRIGTKGRTAWFRHWLSEGLDALELWLAAERSAPRYCVGDRVSVADVCLIPLLDVGRRNGIALEDFPRLLDIERACMEIEAFRAIHSAAARPRS